MATESERPKHSCNTLTPYSGTPIVRWLVIQGTCPNRKTAASANVLSNVRINGAKVQSCYHMVQETDTVEYNGRILTSRQEGHVHYILHKPSGCLSSKRNMRQLKGGAVVLDSRPTVYDFIPPHHRARVNSIGRLDFDTTGLLLFTSDGMLQHALASPQFKVDKIYVCTLRSPEPLSEEAIAQLQEGVVLPHAKGATVRGRARNVTSENGNHGVVELCIQGGYTHQVKLMLRLVNRPLSHLHRRSFADFELPNDLAIGSCRLLRQEEVDQLYQLAKRQIERERVEASVSPTVE